MHKLLSAAVCTLLLMTAPASGGVTGSIDDDDVVKSLVTLKSDAVIDDRIVRLGDLFEGIVEPALSDTPVAQAPRLGDTVDIGARWLYAVARAHGIDWQPRSRYDRISVRRASSKIGTADIESALRLALSDRGLDGEMQLALDNPGIELQVPSSSESSVAVSGLTLDGKSGRFVAYVVAPAQGEPLARVSVTGRALRLIEVPVLRRNLRPGDVIRSSDIEWISLPANRLTRGTVSDQQALLGMSPRRPIRSQEVIRTSDLETPVVVAKNSLVTIRLQTQRMELSVRGRALDDGAQGDVVRVMNTTSNSVVNAVVIDAGTVVVTPLAAAGAN